MIISLSTWPQGHTFSRSSNPVHLDLAETKLNCNTDFVERSDHYMMRCSWPQHDLGHNVSCWLQCECLEEERCSHWALANQTNDGGSCELLIYKYCDGDSCTVHVNGSSNASLKIDRFECHHNIKLNQPTKLNLTQEGTEWILHWDVKWQEDLGFNKLQHQVQMRSSKESNWKLLDQDPGKIEFKQNIRVDTAGLYAFRVRSRVKNEYSNNGSWSEWSRVLEEDIPFESLDTPFTLVQLVLLLVFFTAVLLLFPMVYLSRNRLKQIVKKVLVPVPSPNHSSIFDFLSTMSHARSNGDTVQNTIHQGDKELLAVLQVLSEVNKGNVTDIFIHRGSSLPLKMSGLHNSPSIMNHSNLEYFLKFAPLSVPELVDTTDMALHPQAQNVTDIQKNEENLQENKNNNEEERSTVNQVICQEKKPTDGKQVETQIWQTEEFEEELVEEMKVEKEELIPGHFKPMLPALQMYVDLDYVVMDNFAIVS
uniref:Uncharacterized protein n=2 Tax=Eptatretus burgeri TaxID=7764 RepID=A0A8C4QKW6_EPTBU